MLPVLEYFLSQVRVCIYFLRPFYLSSPCGTSYNVNVSAFNIVSEVSETVLILFLILCCGSDFHDSVLLTLFILLTQLFCY